MRDPLAFFLTWTTYGTWLPGDSRGWTDYRGGWQLPSPIRQLEATARMVESACRLDLKQRAAVEQVLADHCRLRNWVLHAANCRSNHVHVVVAASLLPTAIASQFKAWCTRRLKQLQLQRESSWAVRSRWWTERGSARWIFDESSLEAAILYVREGQERPQVSGQRSPARDNFKP